MEYICTPRAPVQFISCLLHPLSFLCYCRSSSFCIGIKPSSRDCTTATSQTSSTCAKQTIVFRYLRPRPHHAQSYAVYDENEAYYSFAQSQSPAMASVEPATRKRVLRVIAISLLLDLVRTQPRTTSAWYLSLLTHIYRFHSPSSCRCSRSYWNFTEIARFPRPLLAELRRCSRMSLLA